MNRLLVNVTHDTISALMYSLATPHAGDAERGLNTPYNDLTAFALRQQSRLPDYLRPPMVAATLGFDLAGILRGGRPFHTQDPEHRKRPIAGWNHSRLGPLRDVIRYYESLALLALYTRQETPAQGADQGAAASNVLREPNPDLTCDLAVIGSGPGGAITACLLAEAGRDVLLLEEGPFLPLSSCPPFSRTEMEQKYRHGGQTAALGQTKVAYVEARCVGGGSEINSGLYHRTPPELLDRWRRDFKVADLDEATLRPHFEACERDVSVSPLPGVAPAASLKLHEGASRLGWKSIEVPRWFRYDGSQTGGTRQSMTQTYIPRFLQAGGRLLADTKVRRLRSEGTGWRLEAARPGQGELRIKANTVFLCAGAVQTPALLRHSGITRNIGDSLQLHPTVKITARFPEPVNAANMGVPVHQVKEFAPRFSFGCSISSPAYLALGLIDYPEVATELRRSWTHMANYYAMITAEARGRVRSLPGFRDAVVRYPLSPRDLAQLAEGLRKLGETLFAAGADALFPSLARGPRLNSPDDLAKLPASLPPGLTNLMTIHLFSSCPMGEDQARCATDSYGRVHGRQNLYVNDASLLCTAPGVNPQGTIMALARRNTLRFLGKDA